MILRKVGARIWIARIMICWGIVVIVTAGATDALQLPALRFMLGVAEAGFFPGIVLYITFWIREKELARTIALFMAALAVSNIIGAPVLDMDPRQHRMGRDSRLALAFHSRRDTGHHPWHHHVLLPHRPARGRSLAGTSGTGMAVRGTGR
jgi:hypothetical protein